MADGLSSSHVAFSFDVNKEYEYGDGVTAVGVSLTVLTTVNLTGVINLSRKTERRYSSSLGIFFSIFTVFR